MKKVILSILMLCSYIAVISQNPILLKNVYPDAIAGGPQIVKTNNHFLFDAGDVADTDRSLFRTEGNDVTKAYSFTSTAIDNWGVVGSATPNGWGGPDIPLTYNANSNTWSAAVSLTNGEIKFRNNNDWAVNYGDNGADGTLETNGSNIIVAAGSYLITLDFNTLNYSITSTKAYYVNDDFSDGDVFASTTGINTNAGTKAAPFATLTYALLQAGEGDTIYVDAGTYIEQVTIDKAITIIGAGQALTFITNATQLLAPTGPFNEYALIQTTQGIGDVHISNLTATNGTAGDGHTIMIQAGGSVKNCKLVNGGQSVFFRIPDATLKTAVTENNILEPTAIGINCQGSGLTAIIRNNTISKPGGYYAGIFAGLDFGAIPQLTIQNNIIHDYFGIGLEVNSNNGNYNNNSFFGTNGALAIRKQSGNTPNASCNWYGSADLNVVAFKVTSGVTFSPWLVNGTDDNAAIGFQPIAGACTGKQTRYYVNNNTSGTRVFTSGAGGDGNPGIASAPFATISAAYQKAQTGDSLFVDAGTYTPGDGTVGKSISIIGTNYLLSPNDAANPLLINSTRNAETIIENLTWTIGANEINLEGLTFNPNNKQALIMNNTNFGNIKLSKNRFRINSNLTQISIVGNGITATTPAGIVNGGLTIADNRFEKTDAATGLSVNIGRFRNIGITNNTFVVAGTTLRTQQALNFGSGGVVDGLYCANNTFDYASFAFIGSRIANAFITANTINNTTNAFVATNSIPESSAIIFSNNVLNGSAGILPFIQYNRTTGNGTGAVSSLTIENNTITGNAIPVTTTILGSMNIIFQNSVLSPSVIVRGNVINYGGDLSSVPSHFIRPITLRGNLANALVEKNEITLTGINQQQGNSAINLPYCPAITLYTDNSTTSYIQPGSVINVLNNKVHGFKHSFAVYDPTTGFDTYVGFGNIPAGVTVNVNNNSFTGDSISINNGSIAAVTAINATCNWYGSALEADVKQKISIADVQHIPWLTNGTDNDVAVGFQPVANSCNGYQNKLYVNDVWTATDVFTTADGSNTNPGTAAAPFATIDYAVSLAKAGDTIYVDAGTYVTPNFTINKAITILGSNYSSSPNNPADRLAMNPVRNDHSLITGSTFTIASNDVRLEGLVFSPGAKSQVVMTTAGAANFTFKRNYSIVTSSNFLNLNGPAIPIGQASTFGNYLVDDNRFESRVTNASTCIMVGALNDVTLNNNTFFTPATSVQRVLTNCSSGSTGLAVNLVYSNNISNASRNEFFTAGNIASARVENNISLNGLRSIIVQPAIAASTDIQIRNNYIETSFAEFSPIQYQRSGTAAAGTVGNVLIENNTIIQNATGRPSMPAGILVQSAYINGNSSTSISRNIISFIGDYSLFAASGVLGVSFFGNWKNITLAENEITFNGTNLTSTVPPSGLSSSGIHVSSDNGAYFIPSNAVVNVTGNKITGFRNSFAVYDVSNAAPNTYVGYGNLQPGVTMNINNNSFTGDEFSINNGNIGQSVNATCNWYGSAVEDDVKLKISTATVQHIPWLTNGTDNDAAVGFQPVPNTCNGYPRTLYVNNDDPALTGDVFTTAVGNNGNPGTAAAPVATLTEAINRAKTGDTIYVDAGTYIENVIINKSVVIRGAKFGQNPQSSLNRGDESIFYPAFNAAGLNGNAIIFKTTANDITIDGFTIDGDNPATTGGQLVNGVDCNAGVAVFNDNVFISNLIVINNIVKNTSAYGIGQFKALGNQTAPAVTGALFRNNRVNNIGSRGIVLGYNAYGAIENNYITNVNNSGIWIAQHTLANPSGLPVRISGNIVSANILGIQLSAVSGSAPRVEVFNNEVTMPATGYGLSVISNSSGASFTNNKVVGGAASVLTNTSLAITPISFNNNSFTDYAAKIIETSTGTAQINAGCNWYGSAAVQDFYTKFNTNYVSFITWLTNGTDNDAATGFQPVPGSCDGYPTLITLNTSTNVTCNGAANGTININTSYGKAPFTYTWTKEGDANFVSHDEDPTGLAPGIYHLAIVDGNGSNIYITDPEADGPGTIVVTITEPDELSATASGDNNVCFNGTIGSASVTAEGGTAPYTYLWSNGATSNAITNLAAGTYNVTITDANGCTTSASYEVTQPTLVTASITNGSSACANIATVNAAGGTPAYTYLWSNGSTAETISGVPVGTYSVTVTDANGCTASASVNLTVAEAFNPSASVTNVTCFGANNGIITVTNANGTGQLMFSKDGGVSFVNGSLPFSFTNLAPGTYNIAVKDASGCTGFVERIVSQPTQLTATVTSIQSTCFGQSTGAVNVSVAGGVTAYTYSWTKVGGGFSSSQLNISGVAAGNYTLTVTDKNGCTAIVPVTVPSNNEIVVEAQITNVLCRNTATGAINLSVSGGTGSGFTYTWSGAIVSSSEDLAGVPAVNNTYNVRITDIGSGCFVDRSYQITQPAALTLSTTGTKATGCNSLGTITATAVGGVGNYQFSINGGTYQTSNVFTGLYAGTYTISARDGNGCITTAQRTIDDTGSDEYEGNNGRTQSKPIAIGSTINARLALANDAADWFVITVPAGGSASLYSLVITHPTPGISYSFTMYPASPNNATALTPASVSGTTRKDYLLAPGTSYRIGVTTTTLSFVCYNLTVAAVPITAKISIAAPVLKTETTKLLITDVLMASVYPNPHNGNFTLSIESPEEGVATVEMFTVNGQKLSERKANIVKGKGNTVKYSNMNYAILFYKVRIGKHTATGKIISPN